MASASTRKVCANSNGCKQPAATNCEGCSQALCTKHFIDHRRLLGEEMDGIITEHDRFQHTLNEQTINPNSHPLIKQIDEWEKASIAKIQQKATELRLELLELTTAHLEKLSKKIRQLSEKLKEAREHDSFVETDLRDWKKVLDDLKQNLVSPSTFTINRHDEIPLVSNITINQMGANDLFERMFNKSVEIEEDGQVAMHNASRFAVEIRGRNEYTSGRHTIRLRIEQSANDWMFLGINSKLTHLVSNSHSSKSTYGWTNNNHLWLNGRHQSNASTSNIEMKTNDVISLIFDCDNRKISMINERTKAKYELIVNIDYCPFPWQLHAILYEANSCVRILPTLS